jgi:hypothetical protein
MTAEKDGLSVSSEIKVSDFIVELVAFRIVAKMASW